MKPFIRPQTIQRKQQAYYPSGGNSQTNSFSDSVVTSFIAWKLKTDGAQTITTDGEYGLVMDTTIHKYPSDLDYLVTDTVVITPPTPGLYVCTFFLRCQISSAALAPAKVRLRLHMDNGGDDEVIAESITVFGDASSGEGASFEIFTDYEGGVEYLVGTSHYVVASGDDLTPTIEITGLPGSETVSYEGYFCGYLLDNRAG